MALGTATHDNPARPAAGAPGWLRPPGNEGKPAEFTRDYDARHCLTLRVLHYRKGGGNPMPHTFMGKVQFDADMLTNDDRFQWEQTVGATLNRIWKSYTGRNVQIGRASCRERV